MSQFADNIWFTVEHCYKCQVSFAMTSDFQQMRRKDRQTFYCPAGHGQVYMGETEESKLKRELERKEQMLAAEQARAAKSEQSLSQVSKAHRKMRERVMNGVCPCCTRTFQNLMSHMKSEHPDFASSKTLHALRTAFGMTQAALAKEVGVDSAYVSLYENDKYVPRWAKQSLDSWLERQNAPA